MKPLFIPQSQLGIVEQKLLFQPQPGDKDNTKRRRQVRFREAEQLLKLLGLIPKDQQIHGIGFGVDRLGEYGYWIVFVVPEAVRSAIGPGHPWRGLDMDSDKCAVCPHPRNHPIHGENNG